MKHWRYRIIRTKQGHYNVVAKYDGIGIGQPQLSVNYNSPMELIGELELMLNDIRRNRRALKE